MSLERVPGPLREAMEERGFESLTQVQTAVLEAIDEARDLRISSQTGSGKTIAVGLVLFKSMSESPTPADPDTAEDGAVRYRTKSECAPKAIVLVPTRELAMQFEKELKWLYAKAKIRVVCVTGGTDAGRERRELRAGTDVVVGTPGRMLDHLNRGNIDASGVTGAVLDEADRMLDMGFRDELEAILQKLPAERRTLLVSATFPREVLRLASRYQKDPVSIEGTQLGEANADIAHIVHVVREGERDDVIVNLLLPSPNEPTLVFVKTRAEAGKLARELEKWGFLASALTGEMEQHERNRTMDGFRSGSIRVLVATDVAARGIDVNTVTRVIHIDPPSDPDSYTHRSGRTGRAGRKGRSILLIPPKAREYARRLFLRAKIEASWLPVPTAEETLHSMDDSAVQDLAGAPTEADSARWSSLADKLIAAGEARDVITKLLARAMPNVSPRAVSVTAVDTRPVRQESRFDDRRPRSDSRGSRDAGAPYPTRAPREFPRRDAAGPGAETRPFSREEGRPPRRAPKSTEGYATFKVTFGEEHGADVRKLLAIACRRGEIEGSDVGSIEVGPYESTIQVRGEVAENFLVHASKPDLRDRKVRIMPLAASSGDSADGEAAPRRTFEKKPHEKKTFEKKPYEKKPYEGKSEGASSSYEKKPYEKKPYEKKPYEKKPYEGKSDGESSSYEKKPYEKKPFEKKAYGKPTFEKKPYEKKPYEPATGDAPSGERKTYEKKSYDKKPFEKKPYEKKSYDKKPLEKKAYGKPTFEKKSYEKKPFDRAGSGDRPRAPGDYKREDARPDSPPRATEKRGTFGKDGATYEKRAPRPAGDSAPRPARTGSDRPREDRPRPYGGDRAGGGGVKKRPFTPAKRRGPAR